MARICILPAHNEAASLPGVLEGLRPLAQQFLLLDDGSRDESPEILRAWSENHPGARLITLPGNRGKAAALRLAFQAVAEDLRENRISPEDTVFTTDADGQIGPQDLGAALRRFEEEGLDALVGCRDFSIYPRYKVLGNWLLSANARLLSGYPWRDSECGLRIMRAVLIPKLLLYYTGLRYSGEQELSVLLPGLTSRLVNDFPLRLCFYRSNTRLQDVFINLGLGWWAALRRSFGRRQRASEGAL